MPRDRIMTVYRTLGLLGELEIVRHLGLEDGPRYELAEDRHHHIGGRFRR